MLLNIIGELDVSAPRKREGDVTVSPFDSKPVVRISLSVSVI